MIKIFAFLKKDFVKNVLTLITRSAISQVVIYASILLLTRLFSSEIFGIYILFSSTVLVLKPLVSFQYELAIMLPKKNKDAINIFVLSIFIISVFSFLLFIIIVLLGDFILSFLEIEKLSYFIYFIPLSTFLFGCIVSLNYWNNRNKVFKNIASGNIVKSTIMSGSQIITGISSFKNLGLIPGMILGQTIQ